MVTHVDTTMSLEKSFWNKDNSSFEFPFVGHNIKGDHLIDERNTIEEEILYNKLLAVATTGNEEHLSKSISNLGDTSKLLIRAASHGHLNIVKILIAHGANVNAGLDCGNNSALLLAVREGHHEVVRELLHHNARQISTVVYSETPIHAAVTRGSPDILETLLESKGNANLCMDATAKLTPLHLAASGDYPNALECCKLLLEKGDANVNIANAKGQTALHLAGAHLSYCPDTIRLLVNHQAYVDAEDNDGRTPLYNFIDDKEDALKCMEILIRSKCNVNHKDIHGFTPLHMAGIVECPEAAEILLRSGADYSIKADGGTSALSCLLRRIPSTPTILSKVLDSAVDLTRYNKQEFSLNCKVRVNYRYVTSSPSCSQRDSYGKQGNSDFGSTDTLGTGILDDKTTASPPNRLETSMVKCLIDENQSRLLLHPVIQSFIMIKWRKARPIFISIFLFKAILVCLLSVYVQIPYVLKNKHKSNEVPGSSYNDLAYILDLEPPAFTDDEKPPIWFVPMYCVIVTMSVINALMELAELIRSPKSHLKSLEPWISLLVVIVVFCVNPEIWGKTSDVMQRSLIAAGILVAWLDTWIYMGRSVLFGLSIRIFFKVLYDFVVFILPHFCLFAGFILSFAVLFPGNNEYVNLFSTGTKAIRIMAGDISIPSEGATCKWGGGYRSTVACSVMVYIYTAYVFTVGIVLMNLLIGLAVNDIQGIYAKASMHRLTRQTILLNTLESNFSGKLSVLFSTRFISRYIKLFPYTNKTLVFHPYDLRDTKVDQELKKSLVDLTSACKTASSSKDGSKNRDTLAFQTSTEKTLLKRLDEITSTLAKVMEKLDKQTTQDSL